MRSCTFKKVCFLILALILPIASLHLNSLSEEEKDGAKPLLDTCQIESFNAALQGLLTQTTLLGTHGVETASDRYKEYAMGTTCETPSASVWKPSQKRLIINLGYGTTGTRWLSRKMKKLGFKTAHQENKCGTEQWSYYDYIADSPVAYQSWFLINAFPNATFLLSMRDGEEWMESRFSHHGITKQAAPCGHHRFEDEAGKLASAPTSVAYHAWVKCLVPKDQLFAFNLWKYDDKGFMKELKRFLQQRGHTISSEHAQTGMPREENEYEEEDFTTKSSDYFSEDKDISTCRGY